MHLKNSYFFNLAQIRVKAYDNKAPHTIQIICPKPIVFQSGKIITTVAITTPIIAWEIAP